MMIFDTHAHYDDPAFDADREELIRRLPGMGIGRVTNISSDFPSCERTLALVRTYDFFYGALGIHPTELAGVTEDTMQWILDRSREEKIVAIGEIGLDYYWDTTDREEQKKWFRRQLELARQAELPVCIHSRDAAADTLSIMKEARGGEIGGVIHCFSYGTEMAREYLNMGFYLGVGGVVTFKNSRKLKEVVEYMPMEAMVLETDCPYLAPVPFRGKRNNSGYLHEVVKAVSALKGIPQEDVIRVTEENAEKLYRIRK